MGDKLISYVRPQLLDKKKMQVFSHELPNVPKPRTARTRNPRGRQGAGPFHDKSLSPPPPPPPPKPAPSPNPPKNVYPPRPGTGPPTANTKRATRHPWPMRYSCSETNKFTRLYWSSSQFILPSAP